MASVMGTNALATYWPGFGFKSSPLAVPHMATRGHTETDPFPGLSGPARPHSDRASPRLHVIHPLRYLCTVTRTSSSIHQHLT